MKRIIITILILILLLPLILAGVSFIGRVDTDTLIPGNYLAYIEIPDPVSAAAHLLEHRALEKILADPAFSSVSQAAAQLDNAGYLQNPLLRLAANGSITGAVYEDQSFLFFYDTGVLSPFMKILPAVVSRMNIPDLYHVSSGRLSRFEYRPDEGAVLYIGPWKNLFIITASEDLYESIVTGETTDTAPEEAPSGKITGNDYDAAVLMNTEMLFSMYRDTDPQIRAIINRLNPTDMSQALITIGRETLGIDLSVPIITNQPKLGELMQRESRVPGILDILPSSTQYATILSLGSLEELAGVAAELKGDDVEVLLRRADRSSSLLLGMNLNELLYSWSGEEMAAFGLADKPRPVFAVKITNESRRKQVFDKLISSFAMTGDASVVLDGVRMPRIRIPGFLKSLLGIWDISIPAAYYLVEDGFLFFSESPENLLETVKANRRDTRLITTDKWKILATGTPDSAGLSLFYSLDRSVPFFLQGTDMVQRILQLYGRGLAQAAVYDKGLRLSLSVHSIESEGPLPLPGYPIDAGGRLDNRIDVVSYEKSGERRILYTVDRNRAYSRDPVSGEVFSTESDVPLHILPGSGLPFRESEDPSVWVVTERGVVYLTDGQFRSIDGFPLATGVRLSAPPAADGGFLYLPGSDGSLYRISADAGAEAVPQPYTDVLRSPPAFIETAEGPSIASYPKSFTGRLWLTDTDGDPRPGWPAEISGIAFGSPVPFKVKRDAYIAFITQAGELNLFHEDGAQAEGFPLSLPGVFYIQPVFDGSSLWILSSEGRLFRAGLNASYDSMTIEGFSAEEGDIAVRDIDGDKEAEIFVTGDGNMLYGLSGSFSTLPGFPLPAWGDIWIGDLNGDGKTECIAAGLDNKIYGWQFQ